MTGSIWDDIRFKVIHSNNSLIHLIAINVAAFLITAIPVGATIFFGRQTFIDTYGTFADWMFLPGSFEKLLSRPWTLVTHFFLHSFSLFHILFNMLWLWWFGRIYHDLMGNRRTVELYIFAGLFAGLSYMLAANISPILSPMTSLVGASGAVSGFIIAAATLAPHFQVRMLFIGNVKIWYIAAFAMIINFLPETFRNLGGGVAHLAGGLAGYLFVTQLKKGRDLGSWISWVLAFFQSFFKPKPKSKFKVHQNTSGSRGRATASTGSNVSQAEVETLRSRYTASQIASSHNSLGVKDIQW